MHIEIRKGRLAREKRWNFKVEEIKEGSRVDMIIYLAYKEILYSLQPFCQLKRVGQGTGLLDYSHAVRVQS